MGWLGGILFIGTIFAIVYGWESLKERDTRAGRAATWLGWATNRLWVKIAGTAILLLGLVSLSALFTGRFKMWELGSLVLIAWGGYLVFFDR